MNNFRKYDIISFKDRNYIAGGYTFSYYSGLFEDVKVFDFSGLYPSIIIECNISPETLITKEYAEENNIPYITIPSDIHTITKNKKTFNDVLKILMSMNIIKKISKVRDILEYCSSISEYTFFNLLQINNNIELCSPNIVKTCINSLIKISSIRINSKIQYGNKYFKLIDKTNILNVNDNIIELIKLVEFENINNNKDILIVDRDNNKFYVIYKKDIEKIKKRIILDNSGRTKYLVLKEFNDLIKDLKTIKKEDYDKIKPHTIIKVNDDEYYIWEDIYFKEKHFRKDIKGIYPSLLEPIIEERYKRKYGKNKYIDSNPQLYNKLDAEEKGLKIMLNSLYGLNGFKSFRLYTPIIANAITQMARVFNKNMIEVAKENGFTVIAGDTDSIFIKTNRDNIDNDTLNKIFENKIKEVIKKINSRNSGYMKFEYEKDYTKLLYIKKKNYACLSLLYDENGNLLKEKIEIKGLDYISKDTPELIKYWQKRLVEDCILLNKITINDYLNEFRKFKEDLKNYKIDLNYLVFKKVISKPINEYGKEIIDKNTGKAKIKKNGEVQYASIPLHIQIAKDLQSRGIDISVGDVVEYVITGHKPKLSAKHINDINDKTIQEIDVEYYFNMVVKSLLSIIYKLDESIIYNNIDLFLFDIDKSKNPIKDINKLINK